jgi:hypothetical protein
MASSVERWDEIPRVQGGGILRPRQAAFDLSPVAPQPTVPTSGSDDARAIQVGRSGFFHAMRTGA